VYSDKEEGKNVRLLLLCKEGRREGEDVERRGRGKKGK